MPVIFSTPTSHQVLMFDKDAEFMLKAMKTSGNIPGALYPDDVKDALQALKNRIELEINETAPDEETSNSKDSDYVGINTKAHPLIELMEKAIESGEKLIWDKG